MGKRAIWAKRLAIATAIGMFIVLLMGARVTATGSGTGCGNDWPLCNGRFLPADTYHSIVEYSHRLVTGLESFLVLGTTIVAWPLRRKHRSFTLLVPAMAGTLVLQSLMGAAAVMWPTSPEIMATHFGISLICLASAALIAIILLESQATRERRARHYVPDAFRALLIATFVLSIGVAYSGAYVRHTGAELACSSWPTCNGKLVPSYEGLPGIQTMHRTGAGLIAAVILALALWAFLLRKTRPDIAWLGGIALVIVLGQIAAGGIVVYSGLQLLAQLLHAGLMAALFVTLSDGVRRVWVNHAERAAEPSTVSVPSSIAAD